MTLCIVLPREVITLIIISGMVLFAAVFLFAAVLVEFSRARRARGREAKGGYDVEEK